SYEEDLVDQLFNSSEKRLARVLLMLAHFGKEGVPETVVPGISQETLAEMVGTTRSRVSFFMNRFRKLGFIHYNGGLQVHSSLLNVVLHDGAFLERLTDQDSTSHNATSRLPALSPHPPPAQLLFEHTRFPIRATLGVAPAVLGIVPGGRFL